MKALLPLSLATAQLTLAGNALHGAVVGGVLGLSRVDVLDLLAFSIPGAGSVRLVQVPGPNMVGLLVTNPCPDPDLLQGGQSTLSAV